MKKLSIVLLLLASTLGVDKCLAVSFENLKSEESFLLEENVSGIDRFDFIKVIKVRDKSFLRERKITIQYTETGEVLEVFEEDISERSFKFHQTKGCTKGDKSMCIGEKAVGIGYFDRYFGAETGVVIGISDDKEMAILEYSRDRITSRALVDIIPVFNIENSRNTVDSPLNCDQNNICIGDEVMIAGNATINFHRYFPVDGRLLTIVGFYNKKVHLFGQYVNGGYVVRDTYGYGVERTLLPLDHPKFFVSKPDEKNNLKNVTVYSPVNNFSYAPSEWKIINSSKEVLQIEFEYLDRNNESKTVKKFIETNKAIRSDIEEVDGLRVGDRVLVRSSRSRGEKKAVVKALSRSGRVYVDYIEKYTNADDIVHGFLVEKY